MARWLSYHKIFYLYSINSTNITTKLSNSDGPPKLAAETGKACQGGLSSSMTVSMMWIYLTITMENLELLESNIHISHNLPISALNVWSNNPPANTITVGFIGVPAGFQPANVIFIVGTELVLLQPRELEGTRLCGNCLACLLPAFLHQLLYREISLENDQMSQ